MTQYAKIINSTLEYAPRNKNGISNWINDVEAVLAEGYLPYEPAKYPTDGKVYNTSYAVLDGKIVTVYEEDVEGSKQSRTFELERYLAETDWYAIRESETGVDIPADIKQARADARIEISTLRGDI